jgi:hypothetical protein
MYALNADTGQARWLSTESSPQPWTAQYVSGKAHAVTDTLPAFGPLPLVTGPAPAATLPAPVVTVEDDTTTGGQRTLRLRVTPQRPVRLLTLHTASTVVSATVQGVKLPPGTPIGGGWPFGFVFHAPPTAGVEVTLTVRGTAPVKLLAMDGSDGLAALPGFHPRPAGVGILGSHISEMAAVTKTYTF